MKIILFLLLLLGNCISGLAAPLVEKDASIAVMDFGTHPGATTAEVALVNAEGTSSEYIISRLVEKRCFKVKDKDFVRDKIKAAGLKTVGIINAQQLQELGALLGARYIIYGNVNDVSASENGTNVASPLPSLGGNVTVNTVTCHIIGRVIDTKTGYIIAAAKGAGKSKSSMTEVNAVKGSIRIGTAVLTQASVHNAIKKAAENTVDILVAKLFGIVPVDKKTNNR